MALEKREGQARVDRLHPEAHLAELDGQRVPVDAVDAPPDDVAQRTLIVVRRGRAPRPDARDAVGEPARRREQEVPRPAGGVDDGHIEKGIDGTLGMRVDRALDDGIEGTFEQDLHELVRGVVAARRLPRMTPALAGAREGEGTPVPGDLRDQLKKALVDVAELVRTHVAPVHANEPGRLAKPREMEERPEKRAVLESRRIEVRALLGREQAGEGGQPETRFAAGEAAEDDPDGLPEVALPVVGAPADGPIAETPKAVAIGIEAAGRLGGVLRVQQVPFFDGEQEDEPVDQSQKLPEVPVLREAPGMQCSPELRVPGMGKEPLPQDIERLLEARAQPFPRPSPLFPPGLPPRLERACPVRVAGAAEARLVREKPERGEIGVQVLREDPAEVGFDPRRPGEARVVARDAQREPVGGEAPEHRAGRVQGLLQEPERAPAALVVAELGQESVQARAGPRDDDWNPVAEREQPDRIDAIVDRPRLGARDGRKTERVAQQRLDEALRESTGVASRGAACLQFAKARLGDAPTPGDLVADVETLRNEVVGRPLRAGPALRHPTEPLRPEKTALDREGVEGYPSLGRAASARRHGHATFGRST